MSELIASPESRTPALVGGANSTEPWSVEQDADSLMDDLFADLERLIEGGTQLPRETAAVESAPIPALTMPELAPLLVLENNAPVEESPAEVLPLLPESRAEFREVPQSYEVTAPVARPKRRGSMQHLDKILFGVACVALLGAIAWLFSQGKINVKPLTWPKFGAMRVETLSPQAEVVPVSEADAQFANYMLRSLNLIDSKVASLPTPNSSNSSVLPPAPGTAAANSAPRSLEYIPMPLYPNVPGTAGSLLPSSVLEPLPPAAKSQPAQPPASTQKAAASPSKPTARPATSPSQTAQPSSQAATKPVSPAPQAAAAPRSAATVALPSFPPSPPRVAPVAPSATASLPPSPEPPLGKYSLVGLIVSSDGSSAALFNLNGVAQRVRAGEAIGDSGWTLYSAGNQSAVMRRNGEVREIYVGQKF
ncbi:hypothetical protein [Oscillatoria sp. FACHB-1406]|uniref:hypothetical protein n=1 Tax=Oscillatoria sp. FACHB-1406 TaxID=2692846 RepID=UPI001686C128|nr:hypothetical protein [Oscillatoria sp. FACHB-1406]MBD2577414.1 hypothetical protein [Oscillatoria sp. FACHB-1406]